MKKIIVTLLFFMASFYAGRTQTGIKLFGMNFQQKSKNSDSYTQIHFVSDKQVNYVMGGVLPISGRAYKETCEGTYTIIGNKINIRCQCADKEMYPDPIEDNFIFDSRTKSIKSSRFRYTSGSAPSSDLIGKYVEWQYIF